MFNFNLKLIKKRSAQILPIMAIGIAVFMGFAAISVDYGVLAWQKRELQNAADSGALAAVWQLPGGADLEYGTFIPEIQTETGTFINSIDSVAKKYSNEVVEESFFDAIKSTDRTRVKVIVKKGLPSTFVIGETYIQDEWGTYTVDKTKNLIIFDK